MILYTHTHTHTHTHTGDLKNKGITLIALVITIIILLILAGVTLAALTGKNGMLKKAKLASDEYFLATVQERIQMAIIQIQMDFSKEGQTLSLDKLTQSLLEKEDPNISKFETENFSGIYTLDGKEAMFTVNEDFTITFGNSVIIGDTISEVDNVKIWIECAGLQEEYNYESMDQLLADNDCLKKLMNSKNAVDYMVRSNKVIMPAIVENGEAMTKLAQSEYANYKAISKEESRKLVLESNNVNCFDKSSLLPPKMTNGEIICSDPAGNAYGWNDYNPNPAEYAFDQNVDTGWYTLKINSAYIGYDFGLTVDIYKVVIKKNYMPVRQLMIWMQCEKWTYSVFG